MAAKQVVVVGGGVIGTACAWYLSEAGCEVTIVDETDFDEGCSFGNCGFICPSHVLPLTQPGVVRHGIMAMLNSNGPLRIRPRLDWSLWSWLLAFSRRCNDRDMLAAAQGIQPLLEWSAAAYERLSEHGDIDARLEQRGLLYAFKDVQAFEGYAATDRLLAEQFHEPAVRYTGDDAVALEPALRNDLAGAWHYETDSHLNPALLMKSWHARLRERGVEFVGRTSINRVDGVQRRAIAVRCKDRECPADAFVVATGATSPRLSKMLGFNVPIQPGKGYSMTLPRSDDGPRIPLIFPETRVAVTPLGDQMRLGSTMEFAGYDKSIRPERLRLLRDGAAPYLRGQLPENDDNPWYGWRPMTPDGLPIIDRTPAFENVWIAAGHNMLGVSMAPATGRLVADLVTDAGPTIDPKPYRISRFR